MFGKFSEEAQKILIETKKEMLSLKHPYVGSEHLVLAILKDTDNEVTKLLKKYELDYQKFRDELVKIVGMGSKKSEWFLYTPLLKRVLENAIVSSKEKNEEVTSLSLFSAVLEEGEGVAIRILLGMDIEVDKLYDEFVEIPVRDFKSKKRKLLLDELGVDLTEKARNNVLDPVIGREKEIRRVLEILSRRTKNNPVLIGEAGVGKTAIVEELSKLIVSGKVPNSLRNKRIISLDMATTVAGTKYRGEFEERMKKLVTELEENDDIILFIDEIHTLAGAGGAEGAIDASNIFKPALARNKMCVIGSTTTEEYKKFIENDAALDRRFQRVLVETPDEKTVYEILSRLKPIYEGYHGVVLDDAILHDIIRLSETYVYDRNQPDKAIDILDEVCAKVSLKETKENQKHTSLLEQLEKIKKAKNECIVSEKFDEAYQYKHQENEIYNEINELEIEMLRNKTMKKVTKEDVAQVVHVKTKIPVYEILNDDVKILKNLEKQLNDQIVGQEKAIQKLVHVTKRIQLGFKDEQRPYSFLFVGPSGVGKTELSKLYAEALFHKNFIRLDMSEYVDASSVSKILGANPGYVGYEDQKNILEEVRSKPYSVLLLDEIERAHPDVLNLFFQILDEGKIKDAKGREVRFDHVIIIMTSNVGYDQKTVGFQEKQEQTVLSMLKNQFSLPFINRIDTVVLFHKLDKKVMKKIVKHKLQKVVDKFALKDVTVTISPKVIDEIVTRSEYQEFGARKVGKVIQDKIESFIIDQIIEQKKTIVVDCFEEDIIVN